MQHGSEMVRRYPHSAIIEAATEEFEQDEEGNIIPYHKQREIKGRFEPVLSNEHLSYKAKFYTPLNEIKAFEVDGGKLLFESRSFQIVQLFNYQTHCELWLA